MRANPLVCVEVEEVTTQQDWATVIVLGNYEELPDNPVHDMQRKHAYDLLQRRPVWWEPGATPALHERAHAAQFAFFRIHIDQVSGRRAVPDASPSAVVRETRNRPTRWLRKILGGGRMPKG
jgi:nitroimidazol reductase NimA-like FMN-containing flavoprotein (pyridoxamine 5'-phosphate oxidase superfamily)